MRTVIIDLAISINVCLTNHLVDLPVRELFAYTQKPSRVRIWKHDNLLRRRKGGGGRSSPRLVMTCLNSAAEMKPLPSLSNTLNASLISSSVSVSRILRAIIVRNSGKSIVPLPSASTSLIMSCSSASVGFWPSERMTVPSS